MMNKRHNSPDDCTACTSCVIHCPVTGASRHFRGPKFVGPTLERSRRLDEREYEASVEFCSNCKNCDITCPSGVSVSTINMLAKGNYYKTHRQSLRDWVLAHGEQMAKMGSPLAGITNLMMANPLSRFCLKQLGITDKIPLPPYATKTFHQLFAEYQQQSHAEKVVFFAGCYINYNDPQVGMDFVAVMQTNGFEVIIPETSCCGSPLVANGYLTEAEQHAHANIRELKTWIEQGYVVVSCCTSCSLMLKREYQELFNIEGCTDIAAKIYDASEFLLELHEQNRLNTSFVAQSANYLYHAPCHLRVQGIGRPSIELLQLLPGISVVDADAGCCGIAGSYGFKSECYDISQTIGEPLFQTVRSTTIDGVISDCGTCRLQIAHATGVKTFHPISVVRTAYGL